MSIRVILAEDDFLVREGIRRVLEAAPDVTVVAECADGDELLAAIDADPPDVVVTDVRMPPSGADEGIRIATRLRTHAPHGRRRRAEPVRASPSTRWRCSSTGRTGAPTCSRSGFRTAAPIASAIRDVAHGGSAFDAKVVDALVSAQGAEESSLRTLSPREREVLAEVAQGKSNAAIAESLVLTKSAIEKHINSIFGKLGLTGAQDISQRVKAALMFLDDPS